MKAVYKFLLVVFFIIVSTICAYAEDYHWQKGIDGDVYIWTKETHLFSWNGKVKGTFANGKGIAQFYENTEKTKFKKLELVYGAEENCYITLGKLGCRYVGETSVFGKKPNGVGVLIRQDNGKKYIYAGTFSDGQFINGYKFVDDEIQYHGQFSNNRYSGEGIYYKDEKILYSGSWKDGRKSGKGVEYQDGAEFSGNYENGKRNGLFKISRNGTVRLVNFANDIPNLSDCKILYGDGTIWEGSLNKNYEPSGIGKTITADGFVSSEIRNNGELRGIQKISFSDGSYYEGEILNSKRNGYGVQVYSSGAFYDGNWKNDCPDGYGDLVFDENWFYSGEWKNGVYEGTGYFSFPNFSYDGTWENGKKNGYGILTLENLQYEGNWLEDELSGEGYVSYQDDSYYDGTWKNSKRNGYGEYVWSDGSSYYGDWSDDLPNGNCEINFYNGDYYSGEIEYGYFSGAGTYIFANGERYEGTFVENKRDGVGCYYFANGNSYEGEFRDNRPNGKGKFFFTDGIYYEGEFKDGHLNGTGSLFIPEEDDYTIITSSYWSENLIPTSGSVLFANGDEFVGTLKNGMPTNNGTWTTREERLKGRSTAQKLREFYGVHQQTIEKVFSITELVIFGINAAATIAEFIPAPYVPVIAMAVDKYCDIASCVVSGTNIAIKSAVLSYDIKELQQNGGASEEISNLKKQYAKDISGDVINIAATVGFASIQSIRAGTKAKKALEIYPEMAKVSKTVEKTGEIAKVAKSGKFTDRLVRGTVSVAYGKVGKQLVKKYGDDAAKLLFKYGDNALYALTDAGETVLKIAERGGEKSLKVIFENGEDAIKILEKNIDNLDEVSELITKKGKAGINLLQNMGEDAPEVANNFSKFGDKYFSLVQRVGKNRVKKLNKLIKSDDQVLNVLNKTPKNKLKLTIDYLDVCGDPGLKYLNKLGGILPNEITPQVIKDAREIDDLRDAISGKLIDPITGKNIKYVEYSDRYLDNTTQALKKNIIYRTGDGAYYYKTDNLGRICRVQTTNLQYKTEFGRTERLVHNSNSLGKTNLDDAGHIIADRFGGSPELDNILSQLSKENRKGGRWYNLEERWAKLRTQGSRIGLDITIEYSENSPRPIKYVITEIVDDIVNAPITILN